MMIYDTSVMYAYDASVNLGFEVNNVNMRILQQNLWFSFYLQVKDLLLPDKIAQVAMVVRKQFEMEKE